MFLATMDVYQDAWPPFSMQQNPNITKVKLEFQRAKIYHLETVDFAFRFKC